MNIYWCSEQDEIGGLFVIAMTRGRAKALFASEMDMPYTNVRSSIIKRGVAELAERVIDEFDDPALKKHGLRYNRLEGLDNA